MSSTSSDTDRETEITLYNPSSEEAEELDPDSLDQDVIDIEIDRSLAERLLEVSQHLGLNPTIVASRAIDLVCEEIGTLDEDWRDDEDEFGTVTLIQRYQARVDLLQALKEESDEISEPEPDRAPEHATSAKSDSESGSDGEEEELWDAVDEIKNVLDEVDEAVDATEDGTETSDEGLQVQEDDSPPTEELAPDDARLETNQSEQEVGGGDSASSNRWSTVARIMDVFSNSTESGKNSQPRSQLRGAAEEPTEDSEQAVPTDDLTVDDQGDGTSAREPTEPHPDASVELKEEESPPTAEFTVDETMMQEGTLEQKVSDQQTDSEDDAPRSKDWDAVESIIEQGEQARG